MSRLFRYEVRMFASARLTWCVLALLFAAMAWGALNGHRQVREQRAVLARIGQHEAAALTQALAEVARYSRPAQAQLPYWQDPTDVAGFMRYKLVAYAVKPPAPLAAIATGQSRLLPFYLRTDLDYVAPPAASFDFVNPRALSLGQFDLAFVLVLLLPLALIALGAPRLAAERDSGALVLMALHMRSYRRLAALKLGAMALVCVPFAVCGAAVALLLAGDAVWSGENAAVLLALGVALAAYTLFWCCLCVLVASRNGVIASYLQLVLWFMLLSFALPAAGALALELAYPPASSLQALDHLRRASDLTPAERNALFTRYLAAHPHYADAAGRLDAVPYATKMIGVQRQIDQQLAPQRSAAALQRSAAGSAAAALRWLSPPMLFDALLEQAAGTDAARHQRFLMRADAYTETLRQFFWPRALEDAAWPVTPCQGCAARMRFVEHARIPRFVAEQPLPAMEMAQALLPGTGYLLLLASVLWMLTALRRSGGPL